MRTASILNSRLNLRLCIARLRLPETPYLGVHGTGSRPDHLSPNPSIKAGQLQVGGVVPLGYKVVDRKADN
jgi:hypothetical protein